MIDTTDFLGVSMPPFLSRIELSGQLKSPPMMTFSSSSKFSFFNLAKKSAKNCLYLCLVIAIDQDIDFVFNLNF